MAAFLSFYNTLPDPNHAIGLAGQSGSIQGPGYSEVSLKSNEPIMKYMHNSGRMERDDAFHQKWQIDISYNPLTCPDLHTILAFLLSFGLNLMV